MTLLILTVSSSSLCQTIHSFIHCRCIEDDEESINDILSSRSSQLHHKIWRRDRFGAIKSASRVVSKGELRCRQQEPDEDDAKLKWESEQRKQFFREIDKRRRSSAGSVRSSCGGDKAEGHVRPFTAKPSVSRASSR